MARRGLRRLAAVAVVVALPGAASGCGRGPANVLKETTAKVRTITSGDLRLRVAASAGADGEERPVGFEVEGPFALPAKEGRLPLARLRYTRLAGEALAPATFVSTGERAFVETGGEAYELPAADVDGLRARRGTERPRAGLDQLDLAGWARHPTVVDAGVEGREPLQRVSAGLDPVKALNGIGALAARLGRGEDAGLGRIEGADAARLRRAVRSAHLEVLTGKRDRVLRQARIDVTFDARRAGRLRSSLGRLAGVRLTLDLAIARPNRRVDVQAPAEARPFSELGRRRR